MTGASQANGLGSAKAPEPSGLGPTGAIPSAETCDWCGGCFDLIREGDVNLCSMCAAPPPAPCPRFDTSQIEERLGEIDKRFLEPLIKKAADNFYCQVLDTVDDYLLENLDHNMSSHIRMLERENTEMRTQLWDVDRALGSLSMGHETRLNAIKEANQRFNQATNECWRLREELASVGRNAERQDHADGLGPKDEHAVGSVADETPDA